MYLMPSTHVLGVAPMVVEDRSRVLEASLDQAALARDPPSVEGLSEI